MKIIYGKKKVYTEMVIAAHQDDVEVMCPQGIINCYKKEDKGLVAVIATDGRGSPKTGIYKDLSDDEIIKIRRKEQVRAARIGDYSALAMLDYKSLEVKDVPCLSLIKDLEKLIKKFKPKVIYIHNLLDKHLTHTKIAVNSILAIRNLPKEYQPEALYGCEVWRGLDWLNDDEKVIFDLTGHERFLINMLKPFKSQIEKGKRYDLASQGRRYANATFNRSHLTDAYKSVSYAMDLTPLIINPDLDIKEFALKAIDRFKDSILL